MCLNILLTVSRLEKSFEREMDFICLQVSLVLVSKRLGVDGLVGGALCLKAALLFHHAAVTLYRRRSLTFLFFTGLGPADDLWL